MPQFGGKDSKRHFTVVMSGKEHGLYVSSTPSSAAKKAVTKLCAANKGKKVQFEIREITQGSKKKTYGPYSGHIEKLKEPIELKGRVIKYKPVAKLSGKTGAKKGGMRGGYPGIIKILLIDFDSSLKYRFILEYNGKQQKFSFTLNSGKLDSDDKKKNYYIYNNTKHENISDFYDLNEEKIKEIMRLLNKFPANEIIIHKKISETLTTDKFINLEELSDVFPEIKKQQPVKNVSINKSFKPSEPSVMYRYQAVNGTSRLIKGYNYGSLLT